MANEAVDIFDTQVLTAALAPLVEKLALVRAINEAWLLIAILTVLALCMAPYAKRPIA